MGSATETQITYAGSSGCVRQSQITHMSCRAQQTGIRTIMRNGS